MQDRYRVSTSYKCDTDFSLDAIATEAVGREIDECGWGCGERDIGWLCSSKVEVKRVKKALESVGMVADVTDFAEFES